MTTTSLNLVSITSRDISEETKQFLLHDLADYVPAGADSGLFFTKETLTPLLDEDYFDEEEKPSQNVLNELKTILNEIQEVNASFLFLN